jgi:hypothetical protein
MPHGSGQRSPPGLGTPLPSLHYVCGGSPDNDVIGVFVGQLEHQGYNCPPPTPDGPMTATSHAGGPISALPTVSATAPSGASRLSLWLILLLAAAGFALTVLVFQPGYMIGDSAYLYDYMRSWSFNDWQSPAMGALWWLIDPIAPGAMSMFLLIAALYWLSFGLLALIVARRSAWLGIATPVVALAPPSFFFVGMIWRDVLFGVVWLFAAVLVLAVAERGPRLRWPLQAVALVLIAFGVLLRQNAIFAAPVLAAYAIWPRRFEWKRVAILLLPGALAFYALVPAVYYGLMHAKKTNLLHAIYVYDLGGITHFTGENQFPVAWSAEETARLTNSCYDPAWWNAYWNVPPCPFVMQRLERPDDVIFGSPRLAEAWRHAVLTHPLAYLQHRASFMWNFLARPNMVWPYHDWEGPQAIYGSNPYFRPLFALHGVLEQTLLFRVGVWLVLALAVTLLAWPLRATSMGAFAIGLNASAIIYIGTFLPVGVSSDFRYAYWCVLAVLTGGVAAIAARRDMKAR